MSRRSRELRALSIVLISVLVLGALWATVQLIGDLIHGGPETNSANELLEAGTIVWVSNNIAFALLYWELDGGGAAARAHHLPTHVDLAFPTLESADRAFRLATPFIDYLYLGFPTRPPSVRPLCHSSRGPNRHGDSGARLARHSWSRHRPGRERVHVTVFDLGAVAPSARMTNPTPARTSAMPTTTLNSESLVAI